MNGDAKPKVSKREHQFKLLIDKRMKNSYHFEVIPRVYSDSFLFLWHRWPLHAH